jgi:hypothetical protein
MPAKPRWYQQIGSIIERAQAWNPEQLLNRIDIQELFGVKRTEATRILEIVGCDKAGFHILTKAENVLAYVRSIRDTPAYLKEHRRRTRLARTVATEAAMQPAREVKVILLKQPSFDNLLEGISFVGLSCDEGEIRIRYERPNVAQSATERLVALSHAMLHQHDRFVEVLEESIKQDEVASGA